MRLLLDTHVLLWSQSEPERIRGEAMKALADPSNEVFLSAVSAWEIAIKQSIGKLELPAPAETWLPEAVAKTGLKWLSVDPDAALRVRALPWHHRDPFDRLLIAQAQSGYCMVSSDEHFSKYNVQMLMA